MCVCVCVRDPRLRAVDDMRKEKECMLVRYHAPSSRVAGCCFCRVASHVDHPGWIGESKAAKQPLKNEPQEKKIGLRTVYTCLLWEIARMTRYRSHMVTCPSIEKRDNDLLKLFIRLFFWMPQPPPTFPSLTRWISENNRRRERDRTQDRTSKMQKICVCV